MNKLVEKEIYLAFEEATKRNVKMILDHTNETRRMVRKLETQVDKLQRRMLAREKTIENLQKQIQDLRRQIQRGGTTDN